MHPLFLVSFNQVYVIMFYHYLSQKCSLQFRLLNLDYLPRRVKQTVKLLCRTDEVYLPNDFDDWSDYK